LIPVIPKSDAIDAKNSLPLEEDTATNYSAKQYKTRT